MRELLVYLGKGVIQAGVIGILLIAIGAIVLNCIVSNA